MNDAQWLRYWSSQHIQSVADRRTIEADELARKAELAANRDGFSVDEALRESLTTVRQPQEEKGRRAGALARGSSFRARSTSSVVTDR